MEEEGHLSGRGKRFRDEGDAGQSSKRPATDSSNVRRRRQLEEVIHTRPHSNSKQGELRPCDRAVVLRANYFALNRTPEWSIYKYHVTIEPEVLLLGARRFLLYQHKETIGAHIFDGMQIYMLRRLDDKVTFLSRNREDVEFTLTLKFTLEVRPDTNDALQILNLVQRRAMQALELKLVGRDYFDPKAKISLDGYPIELWPGYKTSIRYHENDILMCAEITHKVMRKSTVLDLLREEYRNDKNNYKTNFQRIILGQTILTCYNNNTYKIDDVDFNSSPLSTFKQKDKEITFQEYYQTKWNINIRDDKQPLLISKSKGRDLRGGQSETILLVPELCCTTGITENERKNFQFMRAMAVHTRMFPQPRVTKLLAFNQRLKRTEQSAKIFFDWNLSVDSSLVRVPGRVFGAQDIFFGNGQKIQTNAEVDWTSSLRNNKLFQMVEMKRWIVLCPQRTSAETQEFVNAIQKVARGIDFHVANPRVSKIPDDRLNTYADALKQCVNQNPQIILCVLAKRAGDSYANVKKVCSVDNSVPSQVICHQTMKPKGNNINSILSVATKVAIQMACKIGAAPWWVSVPIKGLLTFGFDISRDTRDKKISYGALVANTYIREENKVEFFSCVSKHTNGEEMSNHLIDNIIKALREYMKICGALPAKICIYRDGVGDSQTRTIKEEEIVQLREKLNTIYKDQQYQLLFIIVSKRIKTRLFAEERGNNVNPPAGTIVDDVITLPERYDFFLISQHVRQGTVSPTSYNVLVDEFGFKPELIQLMTYKYTHLYYNWPGSLRVPAVCQYASKLAFLVAQSTHQEPNWDLNKLLHYL